MTKKLGVIVPYRHRELQLPVFINTIGEYLDNQNIPHEIIVINQDDAKQFNRGMLLNIGFKHARKLACKYVVFHDVDMLPVDVDYTYADKPIHLATNFIGETEEIFDQYFGGVTLFPVRDFEAINGYSNKYWDWGYEDTDLLHRAKKHYLDLDTINIPNVTTKRKSLKFNGVDSYVKARNIFDTETKDLTFFVSFYPDDILCDPNKETDYYTIFSIPGYDTSISYNSFSRYIFLTFDKDGKALYVNTKIKTNYYTNIAVTIDNKNKEITMYQDGVKVGSTTFDNTLRSYDYERFFYLGVGEPERVGDERFFKGQMGTFAAFEKVLSEKEIIEISNTDNLLNTDFGDYNSSKDLLMYFDANHIEDYKLVDLSGNKYSGKIEKCEIVDTNIRPHKKIDIPYRRKSLFRTLSHEKNGFVDNKWKKQATRWNQLRFHNEVYMNDNLIKNDGLNTLEYVEHGLNQLNDNTVIIDVGL